MKNYPLNSQYLQNGAYGSSLPRETKDINQIYPRNHYMTPNDKKYLDYSIKELRTDIKRMSDNLKDISQKTNEFINNKTNNLKNFRSYSTNYIQRGNINRIPMDYENNKNNLQNNEYAYLENNINTQKYFYQNNNDNINGRYFDRNDYIHNNDLSGNSFRNPNNNQIVKYNSFKHQIINKYPKSKNVLEILKVVPNNATRIRPNIRTIEKSEKRSYPNPRTQNQNDSYKKRAFSVDNDLSSESFNNENPMTNIMNEYTSLKNELKDSHNQLKVKSNQIKYYLSEIKKRDNFINQLRNELTQAPKAKIFSERDRENILKKNKDLIEENEKLRIKIKNQIEYKKKIVEQKIKSNIENNYQSDEIEKLNREIEYWKIEYDKKNSENLNLIKNIENIRKENSV